MTIFIKKTTNDNSKTIYTLFGTVVTITIFLFEVPYKWHGTTRENQNAVGAFL